MGMECFKPTRKRKQNGCSSHLVSAALFTENKMLLIPTGVSSPIYREQNAAPMTESTSVWLHLCQKQIFQQWLKPNDFATC